MGFGVVRGDNGASIGCDEGILVGTEGFSVGKGVRESERVDEGELDGWLVRKTDGCWEW